MTSDDTPAPFLFEDGRNSWRTATADRFSVVIDACRYFQVAREAMLKAEKRIMLVGWDFDARIKLRGGPLEPGEPETVGEFILWLVERTPGLEVYLLRWDMGAIKSLFRGRTIFTLLRWMKHPRIHTRLDGKHPTGASHHQKIVVIDDRFTFCGGIDMTSDRWDDRDHADGNPLRVRPNGTPHPPWHDATSAMSGPITTEFGNLVRHRWALAGGKPIESVTGGADCWPDSLEPDFADVRVAIARTHPLMPDVEEVREIEQLYLDMIACAQRRIYAESQYFASRKIAEAIAARLREPDGPEIVLINPLTANGWLEPIAMDTARARLFETLRRLDVHKRFRIYHPFTAGGEAIYVHAKVMIVDEHMLRVGSSNMNNRSLRLDTECDVAVDLRADRDDPRCARIGAIQHSLVAEHLGVDPELVADRIAETGSLIETIESLRGEGRSLRPYEIPDLSGVETWLADNEILDPEGPGEMFEGLSKRGLFRRARAWRSDRKQRRARHLHR